MRDEREIQIAKLRLEQAAIKFADMCFAPDSAFDGTLETALKHAARALYAAERGSTVDEMFDQKHKHQRQERLLTEKQLQPGDRISSSPGTYADGHRIGDTTNVCARCQREGIDPRGPSNCYDCRKLADDAIERRAVAIHAASAPRSEMVLVHADGGDCHGMKLVDGRCPGCGIAPDMQSTEFWTPAKAR